MINLREVPMVDKPQEGATLFALNVDGSIDRIKADGVGGGKVAKIVADMSPFDGSSGVSALSLQNARDGVSTLATESITTVTATCKNMSFEEACEIVKAGEKLDIIVTGDLSMMMPGMVATGYAIGVAYTSGNSGNGEATEAPTPENIRFVTYDVWYGDPIQWQWTADGISAKIGG